RSPVGRIAEVDVAARPAHDVVGAVQLLAVVVGREGSDAPVGFGARHLARRVLAGEEAARSIPREAVGLVARLAEGADPVARGPPAEMVARHVAPQKVVLPRVPERSLGEQTTCRDPLELDAGPDHAGEARVADRDAHLAIRSPGLPATYQSG